MTKNTKNTTRKGQGRGQGDALRDALRVVLGDSAAGTVYAAVGLAVEEHALITEAIRKRRDRAKKDRHQIARTIAKYDAFFAELKKAPVAFQQAVPLETFLRHRAELRAAAPNTNGRPHDEIRWMLLDGITSGFDRAHLPLRKSRTGPLAKTIDVVFRAVQEPVPSDVLPLVTLAVDRRIAARPVERARQINAGMPASV